MALQASIPGILIGAGLEVLLLGFAASVISVLGAILLTIFLLAVVTFFFLRSPIFLLGWVIGVLGTSGAYYLLSLVHLVPAV